MEPLVLIFLGALIFLTHFFNGTFKYTRVPTPLLLLTLGIVIGPVLGLVKMEDFGKVAAYFSVLTLIFLLFESGINLRLDELRKSFGRASLMTVFNFFLSASIATWVLMLASKVYYDNQIDLLSASFFGAIVGGTSSAVVIPIVKQLKTDKDCETLLVLESALSDVLCLVVGLALFGAMRNGNFDMAALANSLWQSFLIAGALGCLCGWIWTLVLKQIRDLENPAFTSFAFAIIVYGVCEYFSLNGGISVLAFGITVGNAQTLNNTVMGSLLKSEGLRATEKSFFSELVFLFGTLFFVLVGISMEFGEPMVYMWAFVIVIGITLVRPFSIRLFANQSHLSFKDRAIMAVMAPKGLVPAILATLPIIEGVKIGSQILIDKGRIIKDITFAVVLLSIIVTAILVIFLGSRPDDAGILMKVLGEEKKNKDALRADEGEVEGETEPAQ